MSLRLPIPAAIREKLNADVYMKTCILSPLFCKGRIQWHHAFSWAGKRQNALWAILPLCAEHHAKEAQYRDAINSAMVQRIHFFEAEDSFKAAYPKSNLL